MPSARSRGFWTSTWGNDRGFDIEHLAVDPMWHQCAAENEAVADVTPMEPTDRSSPLTEPTGNGRNSIINGRRQPWRSGTTRMNREFFLRSKAICALRPTNG